MYVIHNGFKFSLTEASFYGNLSIVKMLLDTPGIDVNEKDSSEHTSLMQASRTGNFEIVKLLITVPGIEINAKTSRGKTSLILAAELGYYEIVKILLGIPRIEINSNISNNIHATQCILWCTIEMECQNKEIKKIIHIISHLIPFNGFEDILSEMLCYNIPKH